MERFLFTVDDGLLVAGRGLVLVPGLRHEDGHLLKSGERVLLKRPDGTELESRVAGLGWVAANARLRGVPLFVRVLTKADVPAGTTVWLKGSGRAS